VNVLANGNKIKALATYEISDHDILGRKPSDDTEVTQSWEEETWEEVKRDRTGEYASKEFAR
jgi:hypothetical protein